jgi:PAS domain S-box-containing protein
MSIPDSLISFDADLPDKGLFSNPILYFKETFDFAAVGIAHVSSDGNFISINESLSKILGYSQEEIIGMNFRDITHPDDLEADVSLVNSTLNSTISTFSMEKRYIHKNGHTVWAHLTVSLLRDENNKPRYFISIIQDISERKTAELNARKSDERLQAALRASNTGTFRWDIQTNQLTWDDNLDRLFGLQPGQSVQNLDNFLEKVHPEDRQKVVDLCRQCAREGIDFDLSFRVIWPDGSIHWLDDKGKTYKDARGRPLYMTGACIDITEKQKAIQALRDSEAQFRSLIEEAPVATCLFVGREQRIEIANDLMIRYWGKGKSVIGKPLVEAIPELKDQIFPRILDEVFTSGKTYAAKASPALLIIDGVPGTYYFDFTNKPLRNDKGEVYGVMEMAFDVTSEVLARKELEQSEKRYRDLANQLEALVMERTQDLKRSNEDLQQFAHVASHDLKEPVRKAKIFASRLRLEFPLPEKASMYLDKIEHATTRMEAMIDGVLKFSSLNTLDHGPNIFYLKDVINSIIHDLEIPIHANKAHIETGDLPRIHGIEVLFYQLFYNLLNNSLKFSKPSEPPLIKIDCQETEDPNFKCLSVEDNGIGFRQEYAVNIFQTFSRLHSKDRFEGTGLGLSLCKKIVERHNGYIEAVGKEGQGAKFLIYLPSKIFAT